MTKTANRHDAEERLSFRLHPSDKQKLLELLPRHFMAYGFSQLVTQVLKGEISLEYLSEYPVRKIANEKLAQVQPTVGTELKQAFYGYCSQNGYTPTAMATSLACAIIDGKINLEFNMVRETK